MTMVLGVLGSVTPPGRLSMALGALLATLRTQDNPPDTALLDLAGLELGFADGRRPEEVGGDTARVVAQIGGADAVVFASPVYRASMTGALKNLLDLLPVETLQGKVCGIVAMGATPHHFLGVESHLRDVLAWFGALTMPVGVYLSSTDFSEGKLSEPAAANLDTLVAAVASLAAAAASRAPGPAPLAAAPRSKG
jgi:FMN reductase